MRLAYHPPVEPATDPAVRRAWRRYLEATRGSSPDEYDELEERAWERLASTLTALGAPLAPPHDP